MLSSKQETVELESIGVLSWVLGQTQVYLGSDPVSTMAHPSPMVLEVTVAGTENVHAGLCHLLRPISLKAMLH